MGQLEDSSELLRSWNYLTAYYVSSVGTTYGSVRTLPFFDAPIVRYHVTKKDLSYLAEGFYKLGQVLFASGAKELFPSIQGFPSIKKTEELEIFKKAVPDRKTNITTIHLFSTCPMGEKKDYWAVNSYGKLHGYQNIYINDGSILPEVPTVNPQGTILALAHRNTLNFLERS